MPTNKTLADMVEEEIARYDKWFGFDNEYQKETYRFSLNHIALAVADAMMVEKELMEEDSKTQNWEKWSDYSDGKHAGINLARNAITTKRELLFKKPL